MSEVDPNKLKVAELKEELKNRGLDTKGNKAALVKRLKQALNKEQGIADADESFDQDASQGEHDDDSQESSMLQEGGDNEADNAAEDNAAEDNAAEDNAAEDQAQAEEDLLLGDDSSLQDGGEEGMEEGAGGDAGEGDLDQNQGGEEQMGEEGAGDEGAGDGEEPGDEYQTIDETQEDEEKKEDSKKRKRSGSGSESPSHERRHRRSRSHSRERRTSPRRSPPRPKVEMEDESWEAVTDVQWDRYNCDLNIRFDTTNPNKGHPLTVEGFAFMWGGARATYGVKAGKVAFEVKLLENLNVDHLPADEANPHVLRVGWSTEKTSTQLGEEKFSYGYGGTGKASTECKFKDYGEKFTQGDVITCYMDLESEPAVISFSKNGVDLGTCFDVEKASLEEEAIFPHVLSKNTEFECNFGKMEEPWFPLKEGFTFIDNLPQEERVRGVIPPTKKEECEIIMMIGLPGSGKTCWSEKHSAANPEKKYNILGTNNIIEKMKVMGLPRKRNYAGRWDVLIDKSTKCLNRLIEIAARKKRNYILDQTNVYASARRRKMQPFEGFQRKAVVIIPTDEEFKRRIESQEKEEGKDVPEKAVLEMKANFTLPEEGQLFDNIEFVDQEKEQATELVEKYRKEGQAALPPPDKRFRGERYGRGRFDFRDRRGGFDRDRWGAGRGGRGGFRDNRGGFRDNRPFERRGGYYPRGGFRGGSGAGAGTAVTGYRNDRYGNDRRYGDRNSSYSQGGYRTNQRGAAVGYNKGGWGNQGQFQGNWNQGWGNRNQNWGNRSQGWGNQSGYGSGNQWGGYGGSGQSQWGNQGWGNQNYWQGTGNSYSSGTSGTGYQQQGSWGNYGNYR